MALKPFFVRFCLVASGLHRFLVECRQDILRICKDFLENKISFQVCCLGELQGGRKGDFKAETALVMRKSEIRVLVVDDSMVMRRIIRKHLEAMGFKSVLEASDGKKALAVLGRDEIGLILSDWCMQGMHGIELLKKVRADRKLENIPFIMVSAEAQPHLIMEAIRARVDQYIVKPFTKETLRANIEKVIHLRSL